MNISNTGAHDLPFIQLQMRVHARQDYISPQSHETANDVTIGSFYHVSIKLENNSHKNECRGIAK